MSNGSKEQMKMTAGMDLGDKYSHLCLIDTQSCELIEESRLRTTVRVVRHETRQLEGSARGEDKLIAVDVIHKDFLARYLDDHLLPFAESFSYTVEDHQESKRSGKGRGVGGAPRLAPRVKPS